jgi:two-component system, OmpR family, alkaline phosphatase synthesis response regulator PhoP
MNQEKTRILLVDDEPDILEFISYNLKKDGFEVYTSNNGREAIKIAIQERPQLIILDVMMPDMDGVETCRIIRETPELKDVLVAFLTARNEDYSQIAGFDAGADDYINKPIKPRVLVSRVKALLRRKGSGFSGEPDFEISGFRIDKEKYQIVKDNQTIHLPKKEFELIALLASRPGKVFNREDILKSVWGDDVIVGDRTIDVHIRKLREKLGDSYIRTIKGVGYKFEF